MKLQSSMEQEFGQWRAEGLSRRIDYSLAVMEELRVYAEEGFQKIPHGGIEVGALLLGEQQGDLVKITEWRPIVCDHARGPGFMLSPADREALAGSIAKCAASPELEGLAIVGWFHTHTRSKIFLSPEDLALHQQFFGQPWQVAVVMRPQKDHPPTAGFFCCDDSGKINGEASLAEFTVRSDVAQSMKPKRASAAVVGGVSAAGRVIGGKPEGLSRAPEALSRHERPMFRPLGEPRMPAGGATSPLSRERHFRDPMIREAAAPPAAEAGQSAGAPAAGQQDMTVSARRDLVASPGLGIPSLPPPTFPSKWAALGLVAVALLATGFHFWRGSQAAQAASLKIEEVDQSLLISWDNAAPSIVSADRAVLRIVDGSTVRTVPLTQTAVRNGAVTYMRQADDVEVRLTLFHHNQPGVQAFAHFVGATGGPVGTSGTGAVPSDQRLRLEADVTRLREALRAESDRTERLREELTVLEKTSGGARP